MDSTEYNVVNGTTYPQVVGTNQNWNILLNTDTNTYFQLNSNEVHVEDVRPFNYNIGDSVKRWEV